MRQTVIFVLILFFFLSCNHNPESVTPIKGFLTNSLDTNPQQQSIPKITDFNVPVDTSQILKSLDIDIETIFINAGLLDIHKVDSTIKVDLRYSGLSNFLGFDVYGNLKNAYLQPDVAEKLKLAQLFLRSKFPEYSLIVFDAARPRSIQSIMWNAVTLPPEEKGKFLSGPKSGSLHNFGAAIDLSIVDENGIELDMGTPYDYMGELAYPRSENKMLSAGKLTQQQVNNRKLLRYVMINSEFSGITTEWWHFNSCSREEAWKKYKIID